MNAIPAARRPVRRLAATAILAGLIAAGCGSSVVPSPSSGSGASAGATPSSPSAAAVTPSVAPTATPDPAAVYAAIEAQVEALRGLKATTPVDPKLIDETTLKANLEKTFLAANPPERLAATQRIYELMGLTPPGTDLRALYLKLLASQVAGYYDDVTKQLYVVSRSGGLGPTERVTFAHEFDHALQDQAFKLKTLDLDTIGQGDRSLAALSVPEGDATLLMSQWARGNLGPADLVQLLKDASDPTQQQILAEMPALVKASLLFPYSGGLQLVSSAYAAGGWKAVDALYARPPSSTEQVLHPEKYTAAEAPIVVTFPKDLATRLGSGWTVGDEDTLGEFVLKTWLANGGAVTPEVAATAAGGWGGDRIALVRNGDRAGVVIDTRWDSAADADEFANAAGPTLAALKADHQLIHQVDSDRVTMFIGDGATGAALAAALGLAG